MLEFKWKNCTPEEIKENNQKLLTKLYLEFSRVTKDKVRVHLKYDRDLTLRESTTKIKKIKFLLRILERAEELKIKGVKLSMIVLAKSLGLKRTDTLYAAFRYLELDYTLLGIFAWSWIWPKLNKNSKKIAFVEGRLKEIRDAILILENDKRKISIRSIAEVMRMPEATLGCFLKKEELTISDIASTIVNGELSQFEQQEKLIIIEEIDKTINYLENDCLAINLTNIAQEMRVDADKLRKKLNKYQLTNWDLGIISEWSCYAKKLFANFLDRIDRIDRAIDEILEGEEKLSVNNIARRIGLSKWAILVSWLKVRWLTLWDIGICIDSKVQKFLKRLKRIEVVVKSIFDEWEVLTVAEVSRRMGMNERSLAKWLKNNWLIPSDVGINIDGNRNKEIIRRKREAKKRDHFLNRIEEIENILNESSYEWRPVSIEEIAKRLKMREASFREWLRNNNLDFWEVGICNELFDVEKKWARKK